MPGRDIGAIFQDPMTSLNPLFTIESQLGETMRHHLGIGRAEARARSLELLKAVGIPEPERRLVVLSAPALRRPAPARRHRRGAVLRAEAAGGRRADDRARRVRPGADPQADPRPRRRAQLGVLLVTHNMGVVADVADRVTIMHRGRVVESGPVAEVLAGPIATPMRAR